MQRSESLKALAVALAKAQAEMPSAIKASENPHFGSKFAGLPEVAEVAKVLNRHGLAYVQPTHSTADGVIVETVLLHGESGEWLSGELTLKPQQNTPQGIGSAITYGRRYGLCSLVGIVADEDDDGNEASGTPGSPKRNAPKAATTPAQQTSQKQAPQTDPASEALCEEFRQAFGSAKDASVVAKISAAVVSDHKAHKINDTQFKALKAVKDARLVEIGAVGNGAAA